MTVTYGARGRTATESGDPADLIDELVRTCQGARLAVPTSTVGEGDWLRDHLSKRDRRRLTTAGLLSPHGIAPDQLAHLAGWTGDASGFTEWYCTEGLRGLDQRADRRNGQAWECQTEPEPDEADTVATGELPGAVLEYLVRLVFGEKADYAAAYALHVWTGTECPTDPGTDWAGKARHKLDALHRRGQR